ncbi:hypothetical protein TUM4637_17620 [Shewanella hafniensis]|uniref:helix-turn-helix domain-containing protein n=1 Tax=Shewanella hafniensis TaxID=365590 RepID=UPI001BBD4C29|nr:helix-turn-helix domain-containing protein [Shewanella hafniensis]MCL1132826.1 helix-turn-helix domain-containing protein [Shewanella hafniensis]GIU28748.1 hypothetical protein TUM4637_17620 [Shewanella hafniensis]
MYLNAISIELSLPKENHLVQGGYLGRLIAKPELKFFFIRLIYQYGIDEISGVSIEALAKALGVSKNTFVDGMTLLCRIGFYRKSLSKAKSSSGKGRPACVYSPTDKLNEKLQREDLECYWKVLIQDLLVDCGDTQEGLRHPLKLANRLLLITFLMHADEFGEVRTLGYAQLYKLTGMSKQQLASQRKNLISLGYINHYQPGTPEITKKRRPQSKSCYFINTSLTKYPPIGAKPARPIALVNQWELNLYMLLQAAADTEMTKEDFNGDIILAEHKRVEAQKRFSAIVNLENAWKCSRYFYEKFNTRHGFKTLDLQVISYASLMLTKHWDLFSRKNLHYSELTIVSSLERQVYDYFLREEMMLESFLLKNVQLSAEELAKIISDTLMSISFGLAKFVYRELTEFVEHKPTDIICNLTICPMMYISPTRHMPINVLLTEK